MNHIPSIISGIKPYAAFQKLNIFLKHLLLPVTVIFALSGCIAGATTGTIIGTALIGTQASLSFTKKLPTDHIGDSVTGLDCDYIRSLKDGGFLCRPKNTQIVEAPVYCYRTLARVDCYNKALVAESTRLVE